MIYNNEYEYEGELLKNTKKHLEYSESKSVLNLNKLLVSIDCEDPYIMCTDEMIQKYLNESIFIDCKKSFHNGNKDQAEVHSQIIASLVNLLLTGVCLDNILVTVICDEEKDIYVEVDDGYHRLRAFKFLKYIKIPVLYEEFCYV